MALAVNFEPARWAIVPLILRGDKPLRQISIFSFCAVSVSFLLGVILLFALEHTALVGMDGLNAKIQIGVGSFAFLAALFMMYRAMWQVPMIARKRSESFVNRVLLKGQSAQFAGLLGVAIGLPSIDYLAVLATIGTSSTSLLEKILALLIFVLVGSLILFAPLMGLLFAPQRTLFLTHRVWRLFLDRRAVDYAILLAIAGSLLIWFGMQSLK